MRKLFRFKGKKITRLSRVNFSSRSVASVNNFNLLINFFIYINGNFIWQLKIVTNCIVNLFRKDYHNDMKN